MPRTDTTAAPNRRRSMILQPEDIVPLTAEEAIADIESAMRAFGAEDHDPPMTRRHHHRTGPGRAAAPSPTSARKPETHHEGRMRAGDNKDRRTGGTGR